MANFYSIYFTRQGEVVRLPHNPSKLPETKSASNGEYNVLGIGPIMVPRTPDLREITISDYFPGTASSTLTSLLTFQPPEYYIEFFQSAMDDMEPILYTPVRISELGIPYATSLTGFYVLVTDFTVEERGGETGDFYYDLTLKEWRDYSPSQVQVVQDTDTSTTSTSSTTTSSSTSSTASTTTLAATASTRSTLALAATKSSLASTLATTLTSSSSSSSTSTTTTTTTQTSSTTSAVSAILEPVRQLPPGQIVVGSLCKLNGPYYDSYDADGVSNAASGVQVSVVRINAGTLAAPIYVKDTDGNWLGWVSKESLQVINNVANY